jgi:Holliday junction resolvase RusA-like endonuclease
LPIPFEFIVNGPPVSLQTRRRANLRAWKATVRQEAERYWPVGSPPTTDIIRITITYYYEGAALDVDNMIKPIQDALIGLVYDDDRQVTDAVGRKRDLDGSFRIKGMSPLLAEGFCRGHEFLHIRIESAPDHRELT